MLAWELVGAVVGAGLASGREIATFFAQYGRLSYPGIILTVGLLVFLSGTALPAKWKDRWPERIWRVLLLMILTATGGAMISAGGEIASLVASFHGAYVTGMLMTLLLAWFLACRSQTGLALVSRILLTVLIVLLYSGFTVETIQGVPVTDENASKALFRALAYAGFNAALQWPLIMEAGSQPKQRELAISGLIILVLLMSGNGLLLHHPGLIGESMPFLNMMKPYGTVGYALCAVSLFLAVLSTLTACIRSLKGQILPVTCMAAISLLGFSGVVDVIYPALGICCMLILITAKITNCSSGPFHSRKDMI